MEKPLDEIYGEKIRVLAEELEYKLEPAFKNIDRTVEYNQFRVIEAFRHHRVSDTHLTGTTGYGYDDLARDTLEAVYADVFGAEDALVRPQIVSGTHAITTALFGVLKPGDELLYITGKPYDTLEEIIGLRGEHPSSLKACGVNSRVVPLKDGERIDVDACLGCIGAQTKMVAIQRSCGYEQRPSIIIEDIDKTIQTIKQRHPDMIIFVDNCYGEFVETQEPTHVGADLIAGSLIKNPGGGLAKTGGYLVGKKALVDRCADRLTAPGLGKEVGPALSGVDLMYQGFFMAPHIVGQAVKGAMFAAAVLESFGFEAAPSWREERTDIVQKIRFETEEQLITFIQTIQKHSPINAHVTPHASPMPGYEDPVIMAAGTFIQGASIELSADAPIRHPYMAYMQGGLTYEHVKTAVLLAVQEIEEHRE